MTDELTDHEIRAQYKALGDAIAKAVGGVEGMTEAQYVERVTTDKEVATLVAKRDFYRIVAGLRGLSVTNEPTADEIRARIKQIDERMLELMGDGFLDLGREHASEKIMANPAALRLASDHMFLTLLGTERGLWPKP
jgi:hypothetical protein